MIFKTEIPQVWDCAICLECAFAPNIIEAQIELRRQCTHPEIDKSTGLANFVPPCAPVPSNSSLGGTTNAGPSEINS